MEEERTKQGDADGIQHFRIDFLRSEDFSEFCDVAEQHAREGFPHLEPKRDIIEKTVYDLMEKKRVFLRVIKMNEKITGYYLALANPYFFTDGYIFSLQYIYVLPEFRGGKSFFRLFYDFEYTVKHFSSKEAVVGIDSGIEIDKIGKMFEKCGYDLVGHYYKKIF